MIAGLHTIKWLGTNLFQANLAARTFEFLGCFCIPHLAGTLQASIKLSNRNLAVFQPFGWHQPKKIKLATPPAQLASKYLAGWAKAKCGCQNVKVAENMFIAIVQPCY